MVKNIIINNTDKCNAQVLYKSLELQTVNFIANRNAINKENVKCAKEKIKENLQFRIITPITVESVQKGCDN